MSELQKLMGTKWADNIIYWGSGVRRAQNIQGYVYAQINKGIWRGIFRPIFNRYKVTNRFRIKSWGPYIST